MAEFPPHLYDGEIRLSSDLFLDEAPAGFNCHRLPSMEMESEIDRLSRSLAALELLQRNPSPTPPKPLPYLGPHTFQRFTPPVPFISYDSPSTGYYKITETTPSSSSLELLSQYQLLRRFPAQPQVERYLMAQALREQRIRLQQRRALPVRESEIMFRSGSGPGFVRHSGGTGVFLPRVNMTTSTGSNPGDLSRKKGMRYGQESEQTEKRNWMKKTGMKQQQQAECYYQQQQQQQQGAAAEMRLPQDWTY